MQSDKHEFIVVGSGAGGATVARELSQRGKDVVVIEAGVREKSVGTFGDATRYYDGSRLTKTPTHSREGVILYRALMAGGTTVVACGNATPCLVDELAELGIDVTAELSEAAADLRVCPIAEGLLSEGSQEIREAATGLGYRMDLMPKVIDASACERCGLCPLGCAHGAKWTALSYLDEALGAGAALVEQAAVDRVLVEDGLARGIHARGPNGDVEVLGDVVILAAGALGTPVILQHSGIEHAGEGLFVDLLVNTYGVTDGLNQVKEPVMALVDTEFHDTRGFILSPYVNLPRAVRFAELGTKGFALPTRRLIGIMTKITDEGTGRVLPNGSVSKGVTERDAARLREGSTIAAAILEAAGADRRSIVVSRPQGAHPGGTAAVGKIVGADLQTSIDGLFVCDASVLPQSPGMPPILTIVALAKRLAEALAARPIVPEVIPLGA